MRETTPGRAPEAPALVTGAAVRLGREFALHLARRGHAVALHYHSSEDEARRTADEIRAAGAACELFRADLSDPSACADLVEAARRRFPDLGVLVNSASAYRAGDIADTSPEDFDLNFSLNVRAPFFLTRAFAAGFAARGTDESPASVVCILDNKLAFHQHEYSSYLLAKKALAAFVPMAALELAPRVRVNGIAPGVVMPASSRGDAYVAWRIEGIPLRRQGTPEDLCRALDYLLDADFVTGEILTVDGGEGRTGVGRNFEAYERQREEGGGGGGRG